MESSICSPFRKTVTRGGAVVVGSLISAVNGLANIAPTPTPRRFGNQHRKRLNLIGRSEKTGRSIPQHRIDRLVEDGSERIAESDLHGQTIRRCQLPASEKHILDAGARPR